MSANTAPLPVCDCYKKLEQYGIPLYISDENELYSEVEKSIAYESAFRLPGKLKINESITEYLKVEDNDLSTVFRHMAEVFPTLWDYEDNVLSFWILDVLIEGLWTAQNSKMTFRHQKATLIWIAYFFNYIQKENPTRRQLFYHLKSLLLQVDPKDTTENDGESLRGPLDTPSDHNVKTYWRLPLPPKLQNFGERQPKPGCDDTQLTDNDSDMTFERFSTLNSDDTSEFDSERNCSDMKVILEILYRIFARVYLYLQIQTVFNVMPSLEVVNLPFVLLTPKPLKKVESLSGSKTDKTGKKMSISSDELESERQLHKHDYILPLQAAEEAREFIQKNLSNDKSLSIRNKEEKNKK